MPQPTSKRPGIFGWIGLGLLVVIAIIAVKTMFFAAISGSNIMHSTAPVASYAIGSDGVMAPLNEAGAPPVAPMPVDVREAAGSAALADSTAPDQTPDTQRIIKTGELTLRVQDTPKALTDVQSIAAARKGYIESSSMSDPGSGPRSAYLTLRVPADAFDVTMQDLKGLATVVLSESTHGQDVTSQFVDLDADLRNAQAEESSYLEIMKQAGKIDDVLNVAKSLADVRGRIERLQGQKRYLSSQTDLATISLTLTEETRIEVPGHTWKPLEVLRQSIQQLIESLQNLVNFLIQAGVAIIGLLLPIMLIVTLVIWIGWKVTKAIMRKMKK